ncbi:MAG: hypothetical protein PHQ95_03960 [Candidatus Gracilibacteria bacterium]|nr:hypothetical protein [Candidatus Gracilibacteria bacterium]
MAEELINVRTQGHIDWGYTPPEKQERDYIPKILIVDSSYHHIQEQLEQLNKIMENESNSPIFIITHYQEEKEMRHMVLALGGVALRTLTIRLFENIGTPLIIGTVIQKQKPIFTPYARPHWSHWKLQDRMNHNLSSKRFLPQGILRDGRGRPERIKSIRSRISIRNGSRK